MKRIESPIKRWEGYIEISDPLTFPMVKAIEVLLRPLMEPIPEEVAAQKSPRVWLTVSDEECLPVIMACVPDDGWHLENFKPNPFPASPRVDSHKLIDFVYREILKVYFGEEDEAVALKNE